MRAQRQQPFCCVLDDHFQTTVGRRHLCAVRFSHRGGTRRHSGPKTGSPRNRSGLCEECAGAHAARCRGRFCFASARFSKFLVYGRVYQSRARDGGATSGDALRAFCSQSRDRDYVAHLAWPRRHRGFSKHGGFDGYERPPTRSHRNGGRVARLLEPQPRWLANAAVGGS